MDNQIVLQNAKTLSLNKKDGRKLFFYSFLWSVLFLLAVPVACLYDGEGLDVFYNYYLILITPSRLITDYYMIGSLGAAFLNAGICGLFCNLMMIAFNGKQSASMLAGYFLVVAHCFYGLNIVNMVLPFFGVILYCIVFKKRIDEHLHIAMFATSLGPFISDFLFRYTLKTFEFGVFNISISGIIIAVIFSILAGFAIPALLPETTKMHKGYNLFKAGLAIGVFGVLAYSLLYKTLGFESPSVMTRYNELYELSDKSYLLFVDTFFLIAFTLTFCWGYVENGRSFKGYKKVWNIDGHKDDLPLEHGLPLTFINIAIYGTAILIFISLVTLFGGGVGFTGPTTGIVIASITFSASGQTVKNVWPIALGYVIVVGLSSGVCVLIDNEIVWLTLSQTYINSFAFATGLCPFSGRYGWKIGVFAGMISAILCVSTSAMHGGFVLYNGGFTAGLTALILLPILEFYNVKINKPDNE